MLRQAREDAAPQAPASTVPEGWHPHQLRDKPPEVDPEKDAALSQFSPLRALAGVAQDADEATAEGDD